MKDDFIITEFEEDPATVTISVLASPASSHVTIGRFFISSTHSRKLYMVQHEVLEKECSSLVFYAKLSVTEKFMSASDPEMRSFFFLLGRTFELLGICVTTVPLSSSFKD